MKKPPSTETFLRSEQTISRIISQARVALEKLDDNSLHENLLERAPQTCVRSQIYQVFIEELKYLRSTSATIVVPTLSHIPIRLHCLG